MRSISSPKTPYGKPSYMLRLGDRDLKKKYYAYQMLKVDLSRMIDNTVELKDRPQFDTKFNSESHIHGLSKRPTTAPTKKAATPALQERTARTRQKSKKYSSEEYV